MKQLNKIYKMVSDFYMCATASDVLGVLLIKFRSKEKTESRFIFKNKKLFCHAQVKWFWFASMVLRNHVIGRCLFEKLNVYRNRYVSFVTADIALHVLNWGNMWRDREFKYVYLSHGCVVCFSRLRHGCETKVNQLLSICGGS